MCRSRSTNVLGVILFGLATITLVIVWLFALFNGNPRRLIYGTDCYGNLCNSDNWPIPIFDTFLKVRSGLAMRGKPYLFYFDSANPALSRSVCVQKCPSDFIATEEAFLAHENLTGLLLCSHSSVAKVQKPKTGMPMFSAVGLCPKLPIEPHGDLNYRCVPKRLLHEYNRTSATAFSYNNYNGTKFVQHDFYGVASVHFPQVLNEHWKAIVIYLACAVISFVLLISVLLKPHILLGASCVSTLLQLVLLFYLSYVYIEQKICGIKETAFIAVLDKELHAHLVVTLGVTIFFFIQLIQLIRSWAIRSKLLELMVEINGVVVSHLLLLLLPWLCTIFLLLLTYCWLVILCFIITADDLALNMDWLYQSRKVLLNQSSIQASSVRPCFTYSDVHGSTCGTVYHLLALYWVCELLLCALKFNFSYVISRSYSAKWPAQWSHQIRNLFQVSWRHFGTLVLDSMLAPLRRPFNMLLFCFSGPIKAGHCFRCNDNYIRKCVSTCGMNLYLHTFDNSFHYATSICKLQTANQTACSLIRLFKLIMRSVKFLLVSSAASVIIIVLSRENYFYSYLVLMLTIHAFFIVQYFLSLYESVFEAVLLSFVYYENNQPNDDLSLRLRGILQ